LAFLGGINSAKIIRIFRNKGLLELIDKIFIALPVANSGYSRKLPLTPPNQELNMIPGL
jgi:hypothetical protein